MPVGIYIFFNVRCNAGGPAELTDQIIRTVNNGLSGAQVLRPDGAGVWRQILHTLKLRPIGCANLLPSGGLQIGVVGNGSYLNFWKGLRNTTQMLAKYREALRLLHQEMGHMQTQNQELDDLREGIEQRRGDFICGSERQNAAGFVRIGTIGNKLPGHPAERGKAQLLTRGVMQLTGYGQGEV